MRPKPWTRILSLESVLKLTGLSKEALYARVNTGTFPKPISLDAGRLKRRVWRQSEVAEWERKGKR